MLKEDVKLEAGEVIDATCLSKAKLCEFFEKEIEDCKQRNLDKFYPFFVIFP